MNLHNNSRFSRHHESTRAALLLHAPPSNPSTAPEPPCELTEDDVFTTGDSQHNGTKTTFIPPENSGILAAFPAPRNVISRRLSAAAPAVRMIPLVPRPEKASASVKFPQSAPVNVPMWSRRGRDEEDEEEREEEEEEEKEWLPPHEILARRETPRVACSVFEGFGRTLKGRDLRQVRNAVWRKTGFLD